MLKAHSQALFANIIWGSLPIYFFLIGNYPPIFLLAVQMVATLVTLLILLPILGQLQPISINWRTLKQSAVPACLLVINWGSYAVAVKSGYVVEASYAYLILPILLLVTHLFTQPKSSMQQGLCTLFSVTLVAIHSLYTGVFPFVGLAIALPFLLYLLWHGRQNTAPIEGLLHETMLMLPLALCIFAYGEFPPILGASSQVYFSLFLLGVLTVLPLVMFVNASKTVSFSMLSVYQLISPMLGLMLGIYLYQQQVSAMTLFTYFALAMILATYNLTSLRRKAT